MTPQELVYRNRMNEEDRTHYEERAAIMEFDGGADREHAEAEAVWDTLQAQRLFAIVARMREMYQS